MNLTALIPTYNHGPMIARVVTELRAAYPELPLIVIDDGSTDETAAALAALADPQVRVITLPHNRGKGRALQEGFRHALAAGFTHALTLDADGQHDVRDVAALRARPAERPDALIIGNRDMDACPTVPARSRAGRNLARFWLHVQTGIDIPDSQCGLRVYPLAHVTRLRHWFGRFDFETETLARLAWSGVPIVSVPVRCIYFTGPARVSHYRPTIDTLRGIRVNVFLTLRRIVPLPFPRLVPRPHAAALVEGSFFRWTTWKSLLRRMLAMGSSNAQLSTAIAVGVFVGVTPTFPLQTIISVYLAQRLHLNILAAVLGSQISWGPLWALWMVLSIQVGHLLTQGEWLTLQSTQLTQFSWHNVGHLGVALLLGSLIVAAALAAVSLFASRAVLGVMRPRGAVPQDPLP